MQPKARWLTCSPVVPNGTVCIRALPPLPRPVFAATIWAGARSRSNPHFQPRQLALVVGDLLPYPGLLVAQRGDALLDALVVLGEQGCPLGHRLIAAAGQLGVAA